MGGNITFKSRYAYTTGTLGTALETITYTYGDATWGDLLTSYNGQAITYDAIGNPLSDGTWSYTWEMGRQLATQSNGNTTWNYDYDANGQRITRTDGNTTYEYGYYGSTLVYEKITQGNTVVAEMYITYGEAGPLYIEYNGTIYYYILNGQGDVVGLAEWDIPPAVIYSYNAWGEIESVSGTKASTLGVHNPLRYRGYVYDTETELYYLNSRYYNPEWGRFLSPEPNIYLGGIDTGAGLLAYNVYAYCANNPIAFKDDTGEGITLTCIIIGAIIGAFGGWAYTKIFNIPKEKAWKYILGGALVGGAFGGCVGYALSAGSGAELWSGKGMKSAATMFAKKNGLKVLGQTLRGKILNMLSRFLPKKIMRTLWENASINFLLSKAGNQEFIHVFITADAYNSLDSIFNTVELSIVAELGYKIIWHFIK